MTRHDPTTAVPADTDAPNGALREPVRLPARQAAGEAGEGHAAIQVEGPDR